ncbi:MAG: hypothetical protein RL556_251 [Actinomycetota bacterium]|jgi:2-keto-4-pentenoate hydratase/2-oxohepta-3-ene-1,7-dioic acid hydratase in catechol pathway
MRIARFNHNGEVKYGVFDEGELVVFKDHPLAHDYETTGERIAFDEIRFLAPTFPSKIVCIGKNYAAHANELGLSIESEPTIFFKPTSALVGPGEAILIPPQSNQIELEAELTIVISKFAKNITKEQAPEYIWGFTISNDVTARDLQFSDDQWARSKAFDTFCPMGPWIETDFVPNGQIISSTIDGIQHQSASIDTMLHDPYEIVAYVSQNMTLVPGDVILTGTPAGISRIVAGNTVECSVEGIGTLSNPVR